ncbi:MAG: addiction module antidote protein [Myxococcaceae bacterium]
MSKKLISYQEDRNERLKDSEYAAEYIKAALEEDDPKVFLMALRNVADAQGIAQLAQKSHLSRENLYTTLSVRGNPRLSSLYAIMNALGLHLSVQHKPVCVAI